MFLYLNIHLRHVKKITQYTSTHIYIHETISAINHIYSCKKAIFINEFFLLVVEQQIATEMFDKLVYAL